MESSSVCNVLVVSLSHAQATRCLYSPTANFPSPTIAVSSSSSSPSSSPSLFSWSSFRSSGSSFLSLPRSITRWTGRSLTLLDPTYATKYIPIIASVSEHQPTTWTTFFLDLQIMVPLAPVGIYLLFKEMSDGNIFLILYGTISWYFAGTAVRPDSFQAS